MALGRGVRRVSGPLGSVLAASCLQTLSLYVVGFRMTAWDLTAWT